MSDSTLITLKKVGSEILKGRLVSFVDPSMKNNTASILKSTRVRNIPMILFKQNYPCACPIYYRSGYSRKHINSPQLTVLSRSATAVLSNFLVALYMLSLRPFDISVGVGAFVIGLSQICSFFLTNL